MPVSNTVRQDDNSLGLKEIFFMCLSNWKWFVLSLIVCLGAACIHILRSTPVYTRNACLMMKDDKKSGNFTGELSETFSAMGISSSSYNVINEMKALQSPTIIEEVVRRLDLNVSYKTKGTFHDNVLYGHNNPLRLTFLDVNQESKASMMATLEEDSTFVLSAIRFADTEFDTSIKGHCGDTLSTPMGRIVVERPVSVASWTGDVYVSLSPVRNAARSYSGRLNVELADKNATLLNISFNDVSIQRADDFISTLIAVYNEKWIQDKNQIANSTSIFIDERLALIEMELGAVDKDISSYKSEHLIPDIREASNMYMAQANQAELNEVELNNQLYMARYVRNYLSSGDELKLIPSISGVGSADLANQIRSYNEMLLQRNNLVANSTQNHPLIKDMDSNLREMRTAIINSIDNQIVVLESRISSQRNYGAKATRQMASNPDHAQHLLDVQRQQKVKEAIYLYLLQKREENELSKAFTAYNTRIIAPPYGSDAPSSPRKSMILLVALVLGLAIPFAILYLQRMLDTTVKTRTDIEGRTNVPFLGELPLANQKKRGAMLRLFRKGKSPDYYDAVRKGSRNQINEAFRILRTNVEFLMGKGAGNVVAVTSFNAGSGKSFVTNNLALALAIKEKRVLVIDCDLRKAATSRFYGKPKNGLSQYLAGYCDNVEELLLTNGQQPTFRILPAGSIPPNPTELISNDRFAELVERMRTEFDYIFLDCPPADVVADTALAERCADRTLFIVRSGLFQRNMLSVLENNFRTGKHKNLAIVLNGVETVSRRYGHYGYGYGYGYGYAYGYGDSGEGYYSDK